MCFLEITFDGAGATQGGCLEMYFFNPNYFRTKHRRQTHGAMEYILYTRVMESPITFSELQARLSSVQAGGESSVVFGCPYLLVDIKGWQSGAGKNPL